MLLSNYFCRHSPGSGLLLALLFIAGITACNNHETTEEPTNVTVGITTSFLGEAATFTANEKGFFKDHGLDVTFKHNPSGGVSIRDLARKEVDIAHISETPFIYALLDTSYSVIQPVPSFQIFGNMIIADEVQKIIARKDQGIRKPEDITGKKIAIYRDTQLDYYLDSFLLEHQIPKNSITLVNLKPESHAEAIESGDVDIVVTWEPFASQIHQMLGDQALILKTKLNYSTMWMAVTLDSYAESNPEIQVAYLRAIKKAQKYIRKHPGETQELMARRTGASTRVIESLWQMIDYELSLSERMLILLEDQRRWMLQDIHDDTTDINFKEFINFNPMREVHPGGITIIQ